MPTSKDLKDLDSQLKKTVISAESFKRGSSLDSSRSIANIHKTLSNLAEHTRKLAVRFINLEKVVDNNSRKITILKNLSQSQSKRISGDNIGAKLPGSSTSNVEDSISAIAKSVSSIAEIMASRKKLADNTAAYEKRKAEQEKRGLAESKLENVFTGIARTAEKIITPVKSLLDRILEFIGTVILGRIIFKIIEWFGKKDNQEKVQSLIRFFKDHWPKLLALYLVFGNSFGRFVFSLTKTLIGGAIKLGIAIAKLLAAKKVAGAGSVAKFLGKRGGLIGAGLATAVTVGGALAVTNTLKGEEKPNTQKFSGGGLAIPRFAGGGFNFKGMLDPLGMLFGGAFGSGKPQEMMSGFVSGEKGIDKVPAMLSDGEFVMSRGAVAKYGVDTLEAMNAAGGGTNKPKIMSGTTYAQGGGLVGNKPKQDEIKNQQKDAAKTPNAARAAQQLQIKKALTSGKGISTGTSESDVRKEWNNVFNNIDHPLFYKVVSDPSYNYTQFKKDYLSKQSEKPKSTYKPYVSRFAGARDAAHERAKRIQPSRPYVNPFSPGGMFGGPRMQARLDYAAGKGKYYSSSDQKTYGNYNDAVSAKKSRLTSLASQQRLNKLSFAGASRNKSRGVRIDAEDKARSQEVRSRGGAFGQMMRLSTRIFGGEKGRSRVEASDKASQSRVKQAGAASIGRYYSSSDGKYYKDYNAAVKAKKLRLAEQQKKSSGVKPPVKPSPKPYVASGGGMGGKRGSGANPSGTKPPKFGATCPKNGNQKKKILGIF
jgi:hypothetical protein